MSLTPFLHLDAPLAGLAAGDAVHLSAAQRSHLERVLRLAPGAVVEVADGAGWSAPGVLTEGGVRLTGDARLTPEPTPRLVLAQGLPKGRKLDEVLRQATELGVDEVRVLTTARSVPRLEGDRGARARGRWEAVVWAASEQSRRTRRPSVRGPLSLERCVGPEEVVLVAHPGAPGLPRVAQEVTGAPAVVLAVGPEGGFTDEEVADAVTSGALAVGLGQAVLRTEHAGPAGLAVLSAVVGRWG